MQTPRYAYYYFAEAPVASDVTTMHDNCRLVRCEELLEATPSQQASSSSTTKSRPTLSSRRGLPDRSGSGSNTDMPAAAGGGGRSKAGALPPGPRELALVLQEYLQEL